MRVHIGGRGVPEPDPRDREPDDRVGLTGVGREQRLKPWDLQTPQNERESDKAKNSAIRASVVPVVATTQSAAEFDGKAAAQRSTARPVGQQGGFKKREQQPTSNVPNNSQLKTAFKSASTEAPRSDGGEPEVALGW